MDNEQKQYYNPCGKSSDYECICTPCEAIRLFRWCFVLFMIMVTIACVVCIVGISFYR